MASHTISLNQLVRPRPAIMSAQDNMPKIGTSGTNGVLKALGKSGFVFLKIMIIFIVVFYK